VGTSSERAAGRVLIELLLIWVMNRPIDHVSVGSAPP
jgi:hypothetical protein